MRVAEYLGQRTETCSTIKPQVSATKPSIACPFRPGNCEKLIKGQPPVCSVRGGKEDSLWIVCPHRLCASNPVDAPLVPYQKQVLAAIASEIMGKKVDEAEIAVKREARVRREPGKNRPDDSKADYLLIRVDPETLDRDDLFRPVLLEMQGGGETSNTGVITRAILEWETGRRSMSEALLTDHKGVGAIETNAWRRQQEQFLFKGNVVTKSNGRIVFAMGERLFEKVMGNILSPAVQIDRSGGWSLALVVFEENYETGSIGVGNSVRLRINSDKSFYTDYNGFVRSLTDQGMYDPELFGDIYYWLGDAWIEP